MELYRGDSFIKTLKLNQDLKSNDIVKYAVLLSKTAEDYLYENEITISETTDEVELSIPITETEKFPIGTLLFEVEVTYSGIVKTEQYRLEIKRDGIYERA